MPPEARGGPERLVSQRGNKRSQPARTNLAISVGEGENAAFGPQLIDGDG